MMEDTTKGLISFVRILISIAAIITFCFGLVGAEEYKGPDDPKAIMAANKALHSLGPDRGGIPINSEQLQVIGLPDLAVAGEKEHMEELLNEIGAHREGTETVVDLSADVLFGFDSWDLRPESEAILNKVCEAIRNLKASRVLVEGHTDSKGSEAYNQNLSEKRAATVKKWLISKGNLNNIEIVAIGYGETRPIAPNTNPDGSDNPEGRAKNRRVQIRIQ